MLSLIGDVITGGLNYHSAKQNRRFQQMMSNTAYQRAAVDLEKAGLNRILALGSPASTPGGSVATFPNFGESIRDAQSTASGIALQETQGEEIIARTIGTQADNAKKILESQAWQALYPLVEAAAGSAKKFMEMLADPEQWPKITNAIKETAQPILDDIQRIIKKEIRDMPDYIINLILEQPTQAIKEGLLNLGPGRP